MKVVVLVARGLRASAIGCYGNLWIETPTLDALAAEGIIFDHHYTDAADPVGARRAWRTGRYRLPQSAGTELPEPPGEDLLEVLRAQGVATFLLQDESRPVPFEFASGWGQVERVVPSEEETPLEDILRAAQTALEQLANKDHWLLWIDLATLLPPWNVPEDFQAPYFQGDETEENEEEEGEEEEEPLTPLSEVPDGFLPPEDDSFFLRLQSSYAAAVSYLDAGIGQLLEELRGLGDEEPVVIVTADCGLALGDHGYVGSVRPDLHEEIVHLPLLIRLPGAAQSGRRVAALTQSVDLPATLVDLFGAALPGAHGQTLLPLVRGEAEAVRSYACSGLEIAGAIEWALRTPDWSYRLPIQAAGAEPLSEQTLFVQPDDRWEVNNVLQHHLEWAERLEQTLRGFVEATHQPGPLKPPPLPSLETEPNQPSPTSGGPLP
jgi:arylsulfatase A-like enzyme